MAMLAVKAEEGAVEQRLARVEAHVEHIQSDISEMKMDLRRLAAKTDQVQSAVHSLALSTEKGLASLTRWGIGLYIALVAGLATAFMGLVQRMPPVQ